MKITVDKSTVTDALKRVGHFCSRKSSLPVLTNIRLSADGESLTIEATNLDQYMSVSIGASVEVSGSVLTPASKFAAIIAAAGTVDVEIESDGCNTTITAGKYQATLQGVDESDWPAPPSDTSSPISIPGDRLGKAIAQTVGCASTDPSRYILNGVLIESSDSGVFVVCTDGRQLAWSEVGDARREFSAVIPTLAADAISRECVDPSASICIGEDSLLLSGEDVKLWTRTIVGRFPEWRVVIPDAEKMTRVGILRENFLESLRRVSLVVDPRLNYVHLTGDQDGVTITGAGPTEEAEEKVICPAFDFDMAVNPGFLSRILATIQSDSVEMKIGSPGQPMLLSGDGFDCVIMPMRK